MTPHLLLLGASCAGLAGLAVTRLRAWTRRKREPFRAQKIDAFMIAITLLLIVRVFILCPYVVTGNSMQPTLEPKELLLACPTAYWFKKPSNGDIVVANHIGSVVVKRIVGKRNDLLEKADNGLYYIGPGHSSPRSGPGRRLQDDEIFLQGDNVRNSLDSRSLGPFKESAILGKIVWVIWPLSRAGPLR